MKKKKCSKCRRTKEVKLFPKNASMQDGLNHYCKKCNRERLAAYAQTKAGKAAIKRATEKRTLERRKQARLKKRKKK